MVANTIIPAYDQLLDFLVEQASPAQILAFKVSEEVVERAEELTEKNKTGKLSSDEAGELEQLLQFNRFVTLLKLKAHKALNQS